MCLSKETEEDQHLLVRCLNAQEYMTQQYSAQTNRCSSPSVKMTFLNLLEEEHRLQNDLLSEQLRRGWRTIPSADPEKIAELFQETRRRKKNAFQ